MDDVLTLPPGTKQEVLIENASTKGSVHSDFQSSIKKGHSASFRSSRETVDSSTYHDSKKTSMISGTSFIPLPGIRKGNQRGSHECFVQEFPFAHSLYSASLQSRPYNYTYLALLVTMGAPWFGILSLYYARRCVTAVADGNFRQSWLYSTKSLVWALFGIGSIAITLCLSTTFLTYLNLTRPKAIATALGVEHQPSPTVPTATEGPFDLEVLAKNDNNAPKKDNTASNNGVTIRYFMDPAWRGDYSKDMSTPKVGAAKFGNGGFQIPEKRHGMSTEEKDVDMAGHRLGDFAIGESSADVSGFFKEAIGY